MLTLDDSEAMSSPAEQAESIASREIIDALQAISPERRAALVIVGIEGLLLCGSGDDARHPGGHADVAGRARARGIARPARRRRPPSLNQGGRAMSRRDFTERDIHMALDGELPSEERADYENWLEANPEMKARSVRFEADRARLRDTFAGVLDERVPARLTELVTGKAARPAAGAPRWRMAAAAAYPARARGGRRLSGRHRRLGLEAQAEDELAENAITAHTIYAAEQRHAVEVGANDKDHLLGWLSKRLGLTLIAPDLTADGLPAGRRAPVAGRAQKRGDAALRGRKGQPHLDLRHHRRRGKGDGESTSRRPAARAPSIGWTRAGAALSSARCRRSSCSMSARKPTGRCWPARA